MERLGDYKLLNKKDLSRLSEAEVQALGETDQVVNETKKLIENYQGLIKCLEDLPKKEHEEMMVPLGRVAYMPGRLVNTSHVTMALGDSWFIETSTTHARTVVQRRIKALEGHLDKLKEQRRLFEDRFDYTEKFKKEGEEFVEITEECTEEEYAEFKAQHRESSMNSRSKAQIQNREKMNLDDFFANYNEDEVDGDDDDVGSNKQSKVRPNDEDDGNSKIGDETIHEDYKSLLNDLGIDCTNVGFAVDNRVANEDRRPSEPHFRNSDDETSEDSSPSDGTELRFERSDKSFQEDEGFQVLLNKLGFGSEETVAEETASKKESESIAERIEKRTSPFDDEVCTVVESTLNAEKSTKVRLKKSVTWGDELVANTDYEHDDDDDDDTLCREEGSDGDCTSEPIILNFKHSDALPVSLKPCTNSMDPNAIKSPGDIYTRMYNTKSILKKSTNSKELPKMSTKQSNAEPSVPATDDLNKILPPAVSASVVERTFDDQNEDRFQVQPHPENSRPKVSKFKAQMARKCQQAR